MKREIRVKVRGKWYTVGVEDPQRYPFQVTVDGVPLEVEVDRQSLTTGPSGTGAPPKPKAAPSSRPTGLSAITQEDQKIIRSPMPGKIVAVSVKVWDALSSGTEICILETMKMEQSVRLAQEGVVRAVFIKAGQNVSVGEPLLQLE